MSMLLIHICFLYSSYKNENHIALLRSGEKIPVSRGGYPKLKALLGL